MTSYPLILLVLLRGTPSAGAPAAADARAPRADEDRERDSCLRVVTA